VSEPTTGPKKLNICLVLLFKKGAEALKNYRYKEAEEERASCLRGEEKMANRQTNLRRWIQQHEEN